jgi:integrase
MGDSRGTAPKETDMVKARRRRRSFGQIDERASGRFRGRYLGPDGIRYAADRMFTNRTDADNWLASVQAEVSAGTWRPPVNPEDEPAPPMTFKEYAKAWVERRDLGDRTRADYRRMLDLWLLPEFGDAPLEGITVKQVNRWHATFKGRRGEDAPVQRARCYALLRAVTKGAYREELIASDPCRVESHAPEARAVTPATPVELALVVEALPEWARAAILVAGYCGLRFGEVAALQRGDVLIEHGPDGSEMMAVDVKHAVIRIPGEGWRVKEPKSRKSLRTVAVPALAVPILRSHLDGHTGPRDTDWLFPSRRDPETPLPPRTLDYHWTQARKVAGREDLHLHDLRHSMASLAAKAGASTVELRERLGHASARMALHYTHGYADRDRKVADAMSRQALADLTAASKETTR